MIKLSFPRAASFGALLLVGACSTDATLPSTGGIVGPSFELSEGEDALVDVGDTIVLRPSYARWSEAPSSVEGPTFSVAAASAEPRIRIGVVESATTIYLGGTGAWTMRDRADGNVITTGNGGAAAVTLASVADAFMSLQVTCSEASAVATWKAKAEAAGYLAYTQVVPGKCTRLFIGRYPLGTSWGIRNAFRNQLLAAKLAFLDSFWPIPGITIEGKTVYRVTHGSLVMENVNPVSVSAEDGFVTIGAGTSSLAFRRYRGTADARVNSGGTLAGINELPMEQYLYGVVPRELGPVQYPEIEAQKAQTIAARTYALRNLNKRFSDGYDLRATTSDQVYGGQQSEHSISSAAIDATRGVVARYGGALIDALYSSASGGHTANSEEAYSAVYPYARGIPDAERGQAFSHVPTLEVFRAHASPTSLRATREGDFETDWPSRHRWTFEWDAAEIRSALSSWKGFDVGEVRSISVTDRGPSGRAQHIAYETTSGTYSATKDGIRTSLRYIDANGRFQSMWSTLFFIEPVVKGNVATGGFRIYGGGFGHGVGLSQVGAVGMASKGHDYQQILKHYFQGVTLEPAY